MKTRIASLVCAACICTPAAVAADGLPVTGLDGRVGVATSDGAYRIVTFTAGKQTVLARLHTQGADIARYRSIPGRYSVPVVAYDSTASGLSQDGHTLVLIRPRTAIPQKTTRLAVVDPQRFLVRKAVKLRGDYSFDAISPDGSHAYLIQYLSLSRHNFDPTKYAVRSLDLRSGKLDRAPIIDPREPDEKMGGLPVTRRMDAEGRWAYTLYSGSEHPFVHALDTVRHTARCIDLDALTSRQDIFQMRMRLARNGRDLEIVKGGKAVSLVDTKTFRVVTPHAVAAHAGEPAEKPTDGGRIWPYVIAAGLLLLLIAATARPLARAARAR